MGKRGKVIILLCLLIVAGILNEWGYLLVDSKELHSIGVHRDGASYDIYMEDAVYYLINSIYMLMWPLTVFCLLILLTKKWHAVKIISLIPVFWLSIEVIENYNFLNHINSDVFNSISDGSVWQICTTISLTLVASYGLIRFKL